MSVRKSVPKIRVTKSQVTMIEALQIVIKTKGFELYFHAIYN